MLSEMKHGVYLVKPGEEIEMVDGIELKENEKTLIFFLNKKCRHCIALMPEINGLIKILEGKNKHFYIVVCDWFDEECDSPKAVKEFKRFNVDSTPTILIVELKDGKIDRTYIPSSEYLPRIISLL